MAFPSSTPTKTNIDQSTDSPAAARSELATLVDLVVQIIGSYAQTNGICDLDATGKVPAARIPAGASSGVDADLLDGQHGGFYQNAGNLNAGTLLAARFADSTHGNRSGGGLHALVTQSIAGFMSATDKQVLDGVGSSIAAATTTAAINGKLAATAVYAVGSYVFAQEETTSTDTNPGGTRAGSYLRPAGVGKENLAVYGSGMAGTWRCMGYSDVYPSGTAGEDAWPENRCATLWLRIS